MYEKPAMEGTELIVYTKCGCGCGGHNGEGAGC